MNPIRTNSWLAVAVLAWAGCRNETPAEDDGGGGSGGGASDSSLCAKYGGADSIKQVVEKNVITDSIAADCRINGFFTVLSPEGFNRVNDCLVQQVQELFGCTGITYEGATSRDGLACRSMADAHVGLGISDGDFDALIDDVVKGLTAAQVQEADINAAAPALLGMRGDIVEKDGDTEHAKGMCEAGGAGGGVQ